MSSDPAFPDELPTDEWKIAQLRALAKARDIDIHGIRKKAEILAILLEWFAAQPEPVEPEETVLEATERSIRAATTSHTLDAEKNAGPLAALRVLARKIDTEHEVREAALDWNAENDSKAKPPPVDNVSIPTYLKYCESLGLTVDKAAPVAADGQQQGGGQSGGTLHNLRQAHANRGA